MNKILSIYNNLNNMNEEQIIEGCISNNLASQKKLYEIYYKKIFTICLRYLKDEDEAYQVLNDIFLKVFEKIHQFKSEGKFDYWIKRVATNVIIDFIRKNKSYKKNFIKSSEFELYEQKTEEADDISEWWDKALQIPSETLLFEVTQLPPATRVVFNLYAIDGYSHKAISEKLNISEGTSKWHLNNARNILKAKILEIINKDFSKYENKQIQ